MKYKDKDKLIKKIYLILFNTKLMLFELFLFKIVSIPKLNLRGNHDLYPIYYHLVLYLSKLSIFHSFFYHVIERSVIRYTQSI
jgi:hypothetical protein